MIVSCLEDSVKRDGTMLFLTGCGSDRAAVSLNERE